MSKGEFEMMNIEKLYKCVDTFILSCVGEDGYPLTKAVVPGKHRESVSELFFTTNTSSKFANAISKNNKASVYFFARGESWDGCYLKGDMEIVNDLSIKEKYWIEEFKDAYEEKSFTDPDFCLLKFVPIEGRFYSDFTIRDINF
jgi:general stress protein 26